MGGSELSGGAKCVKYLLFIFNLLFLLGGLALIIVGAIVQIQTKGTDFTGSTSAAGIFLIVIGSLVFIVCFLGCAGAINNNYCMVTTFGVLLLLLLLAEVAGIITGFVLKDKISDSMMTEMIKSQGLYNLTEDNVAAKTWNETQENLKCCGTTGYQSWANSTVMKERNSVPTSCCLKKNDSTCGTEKLDKPDAQALFYADGCHARLIEYLKKYLIAVGIVAAAVAVVQLIGIIFAFCLAAQLRRDYRVV